MRTTIGEPANTPSVRLGFSQAVLLFQSARCGVSSRAHAAMTKDERKRGPTTGVIYE